MATLASRGGSCSGCLKVRGACCGCEAPCEEPHLGTVPLEELLSPGCPLLCTTHGSGAAKLEKSVDSKECDWSTFLDCCISLPHFCEANVEQLVFSVLGKFCWTGQEWLSFTQTTSVVLDQSLSELATLTDVNELLKWAFWLYEGSATFWSD